MVSQREGQITALHTCKIQVLNAQHCYGVIFTELGFVFPTVVLHLETVGGAESHKMSLKYLFSLTLDFHFILLI